MAPFATLRAWAPILLLLSIASRGLCNPAISDPASPGPCGSRSFKIDYDVPDELSSLGKTIPVFFTIPTGDAPGCAGPGPAVVFYSGFQASASSYTQYAEYAASHGYAVVQYDLTSTVLLNPSSISDEVKLFRPLIGWVGKLARTKASPLYRKISVRRVLTAGHSRGGKLAALVLGTYYAGKGGRVAGGYLIDPVDSSSFNPISPGNPSGAAAIKRARAPVAVVGAGITGQCNPEEGNYAKFYAAGAVGSWQIVIPGASHVTFVDAGAVANQLQDAFCGAGTISRPSAIDLTETPMIAWFGRALDLRAPAGQPKPAREFLKWVKKEDDAGRIVFSLKRRRGRSLLVES